MPLKKRMQFSSLSSQEIKRSKKRLIFFLVLLAVVTAFILYHGLRSSGIRELRIEEKNIERINGE